MAEYIFAVFAIICFGFAIVYSLRSECVDVQNNDINAPLLLNGHRLEVATRDARAGYSVCRTCGFENFKRLAFCSLCDAKLSSKSSAAGAQPHAANAGLSQRTRRARSRLDWTRKLDIQGRLFWYLREDWGRGNGRRGFAMRFVATAVFESSDIVADRSDSEVVALSTVSTFDGHGLQRDQVGSLGIDDIADESSRTSVDESHADASVSPSPLPPTSLVVIEVFPPDIASGPNQQQSAPAPAHENNPSVELLQRSAVVARLGVEAASHLLVLSDAATAESALLTLDRTSSHEPAAPIDWRAVLALAAKDFPTRYSAFVTACAGSLVHSSQQYIQLTVAPDCVLADSIEALSVIPVAYIHSVTRVVFVGDAGVDAGALQREWFVLLNQALADPASGVFACVDAAEQTFYLNADSAHTLGGDHLLYAFGAGRFVGRSLLEGQSLGFHLALPLLKLVLGVPLVFQDLEYFDAAAYESLKFVINNDGADVLGLTFSVMQQCDGELVEVDLIENGRDIDVTDANKDLYLERRFRFLLFESVSSQLFAFLSGLFDVVPQQQLLTFDPEELDYVLCGSDEIDVNAWEKHTRVTTNLRHRRVVTWFWATVRAMPNAHRRRLLRFATGSSRVPLGGFRALTSVDGQLCPFTLYGVKLTAETEYIRSHACFNRLDLPLYEAREHVESMLSAIVEIDEHGFTIT